MIEVELWHLAVGGPLALLAWLVVMIFRDHCDQCKAAVSPRDTYCPQCGTVVNDA